MAGKSTYRRGLPCQVLMILLSLLFISRLQTALAATSSGKTYEAYIKTACNSTTYPVLCYQSLSPYASKIKGDPQKLCETALSIALKATRNASSTISKLLEQKGLTRSETAVIKDCVSNTKDSVDELKQSLDALKNISGSDKEFQMSDIKTWVSAALTDDDTCKNGLDEGQEIRDTLKNKIQNIILRISRLTSIALALINKL